MKVRRCQDGDGFTKARTTLFLPFAIVKVRPIFSGGWRERSFEDTERRDGRGTGPFFGERRKEGSSRMPSITTIFDSSRIIKTRFGSNVVLGFSFVPLSSAPLNHLETEDRKSAKSMLCHDSIDLNACVHVDCLSVFIVRVQVVRLLEPSMVCVLSFSLISLVLEMICCDMWFGGLPSLSDVKI